MPTPPHGQAPTEPVEPQAADVPAGDVAGSIAPAAGAATGAYPREARAELLAEWPE